jgi:hypothetical protein
MNTEIVTNATKSAFAVDASAVDNENKAMVRMQQLIERGRVGAGRVIERVQSEVPVDVVAKATAMRFFADGTGIDMRLGHSEADKHLHSHALQQAGILADMGWVRDLSKRTHKLGEEVDNWGARLAAQSLNEAFSRLGSRHLVRHVEGQVRGIVSDKFRRIDARPILEAALGAFQAVGLQPYEGRWLETKLELQAIVPQLYAPIPGELLAFGVSLRTSDYGDGAFDIRAFMLRPACANGMIGDSALRAVHVGKRLSDDMELSERTMRLDTKAMASATDDVVRAALSPAKIEQRLLGMKAAAEREIDPKKALAALRKSLTKVEADSVVAHFNSPDVVTLPPGQSALRMANAISWLANNGDVAPRRAIELQEVAGEWIAPPSAKS